MAKTPLNLDWKQLLPSSDSTPPPELEIVQTDPLQKDNVEHLSDHALEEKIQRMQSNISSFISKLPDGGSKYRANIKRLEDERERRKMQRLSMDANGCEEATQSQSSSFSGASPAFGPNSPTANTSEQPFSEPLCKRLDGMSHVSTRDAFSEELGYFGQVKSKNGTMNELSLSKRKGMGMSSRQVPFRCPSSFSAEKDRHLPPCGNHKGIASSGSPLHLEGNLSSHFSVKTTSPIQTSRDLKKRKVQTVVLLDEEDAQPINQKQSTCQVDNAKACMKDAKIYYPSRDDPEAVELCASDMDCLKPESFLSSTIMNFYIRYLQRPVSPTSRPRGDYHFFNTYFYKKLEEAVSYKRIDRDAFYMKFRRWWKGVNIFEKAYIFLPIHADEHWSLAIICIPAKEDESGPMILHLDSLGYHASSRIFENIESYLKEEWNYLKRSDPHPNIPISEKIWSKLSRRFMREIIPVPQQKNDFDCGLFVLYFMERFVEGAPERLRKKDLSMFGRNWFKPEDASKLRERLKNLLQEQFESSQLQNGSASSPSSVSESPERSKG